MNETPAVPSLPEIPDTDDPVVLRELLRQAREHLRVRESIEQMLAENVARTEALLVEARSARPPAAVDAAALREGIAEARAALGAATAALDRLDSLVTDAGAAAPADTESSGEPDGEDAAPDTPRTIDVLVEDVTSPALARSLQQHLAALDGVTGAEVRELAEGLLRITVTATTPLTGGALAGWEPERARTVRTERADVLEIALG